MKTQQLILVTPEDSVLGSISKIQAHTNSYLFSKEAQPHRAFSFFAFDENNRLLLHKRSRKKITFPGHWTNSCCSHPLYNPEQMVEHQNQGIKLAVQKRVLFELGLNLTDQDLDNMKFQGKIIYKSKGCEIWGEYEVDYVFFLKRKFLQEEFEHNVDEIEQIQWVEEKNMQNFLQQKTKLNEPTSPWFQKILNENMQDWWKIINNIKI